MGGALMARPATLDFEADGRAAIAALSEALQETAQPETPTGLTIPAEREGHSVGRS